MFIAREREICAYPKKSRPCNEKLPEVQLFDEIMSVIYIDSLLQGIYGQSGTLVLSLFNT